MKKLKRLATGLSYSEVRERQIGNEQAEREAVSPAQVGKPEPVDLQEDTSAASDASPMQTARKTEIPVPETVEPTSPPTPAVPDPALPEGEIEPVLSVDDADSRVEVPDPIVPTSERPPVKAAEEDAAKPASVRMSEPASERPAAVPGKSIILKGSVARPAFGVSKTYDEVAERYGDKAAMTHLVDMSLRALAEGVEAGEAISLEAEVDYSAHPKKIQPKRALSRAVYDTILHDIDPLGILKPGRIAGTIIQGALNRFIKNEQARKR